VTPLRRAVAIAALLGAAGVAAVEPPTVSWRDAASRVGDVVSVEGDVARVGVTADTWTLEFAPDDPAAFRAVVLLGLLGRVPANPVRAYTGRRVRVTGLVQQFQGRPEIVVRGTARIAVADAPSVAQETSGAPAPPASPAAVAPSPATPAPAAGEPPAPRGLVDAVARRVAAARACDAARAGWREAAARAGDRADALARCAAAEGYDCAAAAAALRPALDGLDAAEARVGAACP
jgi:hypothetical protein